MADLLAWLRITCEALNEIGAGHALIGGLAVGVRTEPRFTRDLDLAVAARDEAETEAILGHLIRCGFRTVAEMDNARTGRLATMRMAPPGAPFVDDQDAKPEVVDLLFDFCGIESEVVSDAEVLEVGPGLCAPVARVSHLIAMKLASVRKLRLADSLDLVNLIQAATRADIEAVPPLLDAITKRGYAGDRDLAAMLRRYIRRAR